jgi:WXG100 family type VII secretion target
MAIHLDYDVMKQKANELRRKEDFIGSELRSLQAAIQQMLDTDFKTDSASGAFGQRFEDYKRQADTMNETLSGLGNELDQIVEGFRSTDQAASGH